MRFQLFTLSPPMYHRRREVHALISPPSIDTVEGMPSLVPCLWGSSVGSLVQGGFGDWQDV